MSEFNKQNTDFLAALRIAVDAHNNQLDKGGLPYILHPLHVMSGVDSMDEKIVAILHDVIEDNKYWDLERISCYGFDKYIIEEIDAITKKPGEPYINYIKRVKMNELARRVKIVDLKHNMDIIRLDKITEYDLQRLMKYHKVLGELEK